MESSHEVQEKWVIVVVAVAQWQITRTRGHEFDLLSFLPSAISKDSKDSRMQM